MIVVFIISFLIPVVISILITPAVIKFAYQIDAVDRPGFRKIHKSATPRLGGLAILLSFAISLAVLSFLFPTSFNIDLAYNSNFFVIGFCLFAIFVLGFWDDITPLKPGIKFGIQFLVAAVIYFTGFKISNLTNPLGTGILNVEIIDFPLTLLWIVGITNAFNLIDGLDGLATGVATIACVSFFVIAAFNQQILSTLLSLIIAGALVGFLQYNFSPAKIFLGDSGSLLIGFSLALMSIHTTTKISTGFALLFPIILLGLPIMDTIISMMRRFLGNFIPQKSNKYSRSLKYKFHQIFTPDRSHIHHQLISMGLTHRNTVLLLYFISAVFATAAFAITQISTFEKAIIIVLLIGVTIFLGLKKLRYREIAIFNNGIILPIYERWIINKRIFVSLIDFVFIAVSFSLSYKLIHSINPRSVEALEFEQSLMIVASLQLLVFWVSGIYRETIKQMGIGNALRITGSVGYSILATALVLILLNTFPFVSGIQLLVLDFYFLLTFTLGIRIAYKALSYWFHKDKNYGEKVLIYGANENGNMILHKINNSTHSNLKVLGFLDDNPDLEGKLLNGYPIHGGHWKLSKILRSTNVDYIFICEEDIKPENFNRLKAQARQKNIKIKRLQIRLKNILNDSINENRIATQFDQKNILQL